MGFLLKLSYLVLLVSLLVSGALLCCDAAAEVSLKLLKTPHEFSHLRRATFEFQAFLGGNESGSCEDCTFSCKLDGGNSSDCGARKAYYAGLEDGIHGFEVCSNGSSSGVVCTRYNWTVDTVPPSASIAASSPFTNSLNVCVNITFTEPCTGGAGGFRCSSVDSCDLLVYGAGQVIPSSFTILEPDLKYSVVVALSHSAYGRVVLVMNKNFCTDTAGNMFTRTDNSSSLVRFDRRNVFVDMRTHIPERLLQLQGETRTVEATNSHDNLKVYLYFSEPILNSSAEVLNSLNTSGGTLLSLGGETLGSRRFGFEVVDVPSTSIVTVALHSDSIISRPGTPVSPIAPVTFLYDSEKPAVRLSTKSSTRTREHNILVSIKFRKPVFGFNSSFLSISGGQLQSFHEISRSSYITEVQAEGDLVSISVPENITSDIAGNKNLPSNVLQVRHYSVPKISCILSAVTTACFIATCFVAGLLTVSTASLQSVGAFSRPSALLNSEPTRSLFRMACYIQIFALSRWLAVMLPVEYYELSRSLQWSIPYFALPWETEASHPSTLLPNSSVLPHSAISKQMQLEKDSSSKAASVYGLPLTPMEYTFFFESEDIKPEADYITETQGSNGWKEFRQSMFWLALISGALLLLHAILVLIIKYKKREPQKQLGYGALVFPRFEIFLLILALPCICKASSGLVKGGTVSGSIVGILLLTVAGMFLVALLFFLSFGITLGKLLQYKEVHQVGQKFHWYQEVIRVTLGPGKRGQWTWKDQPNSFQLMKYGALFEDLRGPPKYMLSQIGRGSTRKYGERIIASDDETEDAEAPFIQKLFGILRIYYALLESVKRVTLGIIAGAYANSWSWKAPSTILLCFTSFQLFFILLKKPFIKKKVQLVEIISLSCQVLTFAICLILSKMEPLSAKDETRVGITMVVVFLIGFLAHITNEWYALYRQIKLLDPSVKSFTTGLKTAAIGSLIFFTPKKTCSYLESKLPRNQQGDKETGGGEAGSSTERSKNSGSKNSGTPMADRPWMRQLREMAKASFTRERSRTTGGESWCPTDPSSSKTKWSGLWGSKQSGSSSHHSSADFKSKPSKLYQDLEAIFASK